MTLKDVALKANCSVATVSKALKNSSEISEDAKQRILAVAKECGYFKKATTRSAVLGGFKIVIFNDIKGDSADLYADIQITAKKQGLTALYVSISEKDSAELLNQLGAFGVILKGASAKKKDEKTFILQNNLSELTEFLKAISRFMPQRPSRATTQNGKKRSVGKLVKRNVEKAAVRQEQSKSELKPKEEIWLL